MAARGNSAVCFFFELLESRCGARSPSKQISCLLSLCLLLDARLRQLLAGRTGTDPSARRVARLRRGTGPVPWSGGRTGTVSSVRLVGIQRGWFRMAGSNSKNAVPTSFWPIIQINPIKPIGPIINQSSYGIRMGLISIMGSSRLKLLFLLIKVVKSRNYPPRKFYFQSCRQTREVI